MPSIDDLIRDVADLVPLPTAYVRIRQLINDPNSSAQDVAAVIANEPALTSRILRIANSAYLGLSARIDTVARAVQILGLNQVHDLALATSAIGTLCRIENPVLDMLDYWRRSIYCAVFTQIAAGHVGLRQSDRLFVCGLLHEVGHLILANREPQLYARLRAQAIDTRRPLALCERDALGFDYAALGAALLRHWQLPEAIWAPVQAHTEPAQALPEQAPGAGLVHLGAVVCRAVLCKTEQDEPAPDFDLQVLAASGVDAAAIRALMTQSDEKVVHAYELLLPARSRRNAA